VAGYTRPDQRTPASPSSIAMRPSSILSPRVIVHELFHLMQLSTFQLEPNWLRESTADWGSFNQQGQARRLNLFFHPEVSLDCGAKTFAGGCAGDGYGYGRWPFWQAIGELYGPGVVQQVFQRAAALGTADRQPHTFEAIDGALGEHGTDLNGAFFAMVARMAGGRFTLKGLERVTPVPVARLFTGTEDATLPPQALTVDHLAARFVELTSGAEAGTTTACRRATLTLTVTLPDGVSSRPVFAPRGAEATPLAVSGSSATIAVPWSTCTGLDGKLAVPNGARDALADGAAFSVQATMALVATQPPPKPQSNAGSFGEVQSNPAPELVSYSSARKVRIKRKGATYVTVKMTSTLKGAISIGLSKKLLDISAGGEGVQEIDTSDFGPSIERLLKKGRNTFRIKLPRKYDHKKDFIVFFPWSGTVDEVFEEGDTSVLVVRYARARKHR
jgi:hypothetical protein